MKILRPKTVSLLLVLMTVLIGTIVIKEINQVNADKINNVIPVSGKLDINTADELSLTLIPGVGATLAHRIVCYRENNKILLVQDLMNIKGIGPKLMERIRSYIVINKEVEPVKRGK